MFRALRHRNYRLFYTGQGISLVGSWMQRAAMTWLVYRLTDSALWLGIIAFTSQAPNFFFAPFAGVLADRMSKHQLLRITIIAEGLQATVLAVLVLGNWIELWHLVLLSLWLGIASGFETPIRQAYVVDLIGRKDDLPNAIALNSSMFNLARLIGPAVAGLIIHATAGAIVTLRDGRRMELSGEGLCFLINAVSYIAVIGALGAMRVKERSTAAAREQRFLPYMREGFAYSAATKPIRLVLLLVTIISLTTMNYVTLLPIFADRILGGGADTYGFLTSAVGLGALGGAGFLASRKKAALLAPFLRTTLIIFGIGLTLFSLSTNFYLSMGLMALTGFAMMATMASCNTLLQSVVDDDKRGRVMGQYVMAVVGVGPFGSLLAGWMADHVGAPVTVFLGGLSAFTLAAVMWNELTPENFLRPAKDGGEPPTETTSSRPESGKIPRP